MRFVPGVVLLLALAGGSPAQQHKVPEDAVVLESAGVPATAEGLGEYLARRTTGKDRPLGDAEADALIAKLGHDDFDVREAATKELLVPTRPPMARLEAARKHPDLEVRTRVADILTLIAGRSDPLAAVFRVARDARFRLPPEAVLAAIEQATTPVVAEAGRNLLVAQARAEDAALARKWAESPTPAVQAAGLRLWAATEKDKAPPRLRERLADKSPTVRLAAARALLDAGEKVDVLRAAAAAPPEEAVFLLHAAEWKLRQELKDKRGDAEAMKAHHELLDAYAPVLAKIEGVKVEKRSAANTQHYLQQGMDTSKHPEILLYKIQWFAGNWSGWYSPGFVDQLGDGRKLRAWSCFNDHNHEVVTTTRRDLFRQILDLEKP